MYPAGSYVVYKNNGVCLIDAVRPEKFGNFEKQNYYVLKLIYENNAVVYIPVALEEAEKRMRSPITKKEAQSVINGIWETETAWINDDKIRGDRFREILDKGDVRELCGIVKVLHERYGELTELGRKLRAADETVMKKAMTNLCGELAYALGADIEQIKESILAKKTPKTDV